MRCVYDIYSSFSFWNFFVDNEQWDISYDQASLHWHFIVLLNNIKWSFEGRRNHSSKRLVCSKPSARDWIINQLLILKWDFFWPVFCCCTKLWITCILWSCNSSKLLRFTHTTNVTLSFTMKSFADCNVIRCCIFFLSNVGLRVILRFWWACDFVRLVFTEWDIIVCRLRFITIVMNFFVV